MHCKEAKKQKRKTEEDKRSMFYLLYTSCLMLKTTSIEMLQTTSSALRDMFLSWTRNLERNLLQEKRGNLFRKLPKPPTLAHLEVDTMRAQE